MSWFPFWWTLLCTEEGAGSPVVVLIIVFQLMVSFLSTVSFSLFFLSVFFSLPVCLFVCLSVDMIVC